MTGDGPRRGGRQIHELSPRQDVQRELELHLRLREEELIAAGWEPAVARQEAHRLFGDIARIGRECGEIAERHARATRRVSMWSEFVGDVRYAIRWLAREPGFALLAVLTLALGIGANSAIFGVVNGVLLAPLPYPASERLVAVREVTARGREEAVTWPNYADWREGARSFASLAAYRAAGETNVLGGAEPVRARVTAVSRGFFEAFGVQPRAGRTFVDDEQIPGGRPAVVVSDAFWRTQLGARADLTDIALQVFESTAQVVGVMPPSFAFPEDTELWYPVELTPATGLGTRTAHNFQVVGRLADGVSVAAARSELSALTDRIRASEPNMTAVAATARGLRQDMVGEARRPLLVLLGASGFVLLVACTNLASALLARAAGRSRELAIRTSLGAGRLRLVRQLLTESLVLAVLGAAAGLGLAYLLIQLVTALGPDAVPRLEEVRLDGRVLGFTTLLALATALAFGTAPAFHAAAAEPYLALQETGRSATSPRQRRAWSLIVGAEVVFALLLLVGSGLLIRSFWNIMRVDPGFRTDSTLAVFMALPEGRYTDGDARLRYYDTLLERVRTLPGVLNAAFTITLPLTGFDPNGTFYIEDRRFERGNAHYRVVSPDFFATAGTPVVRGRAFTDADRAGSLPVILINERLASQFFGESNPIGHRIRTGGMDSKGEEWATVVGVVGDVRYRSLELPAAPAYYLPYAQRPNFSTGTLLVHTQRDPLAVAEPVRGAIRASDADVAIDVRTLEERLSALLGGRRFMIAVLGVFAGTALLLAAAGIYAVVSFAVAQRTHEIGIRVALGARRSSVLWVIARSTLLSVAGGIVIGVAGAAWLSRFIAAMLFDVPALDPVTFAAVAAVLGATASIATLVPAFRAIRVSPLTALRSDG